MRLDRLYLQDIAQAACDIAEFLAGMKGADFLKNKIVQSAVLQKLTTIGEAAGRLSLPFRTTHSEIEWPDIIAFRNRAVHDYFSVDWSIVWTTATQDAPQLRKQVADILQQEFPETLP